MKTWNEYLDVLKRDFSDVDESVLFNEVNWYFNQFPYIQDIKDRWLTPDEFYTNRGGDCEDYALMKMLTLIKMGIDPDRLRLVFVKGIDTRENHMILCVDSKWYMDNQFPQLYKHLGDKYDVVFDIDFFGNVSFGEKKLFSDTYSKVLGKIKISII